MIRTDFERFIVANKLKKKDIAEYLSVSSAFITALCSGARPVPADKIDLIKSNATWDTSMFSGEGEMLRSEPPTPPAADQPSSTCLVPLLPIYAQGGSLNDFVTSVKFSDCELVVSPIHGVDFVMTVTGDSMAPDYPNGSQILIKKVDERAFIEWGRVYVLDTCNGSVIKELRKGSDDDSVMCYSLNPDPKYQPFVVKLPDVYGVYRVLMCMALK